MAVEDNSDSETPENQSRNDEDQPLLGARRVRYPKSVFFIILNEFCERFNYYGMRTILQIYLMTKLNYDDSTATVIFSLSSMFVYLSSLFGAIIADSWWGKFKTILYLSIVYAIGSVTVAAGAVDYFHLPSKEFTFIGLFLIAIGSGGIKPCVSAFGGEQFKLPEQEKQLEKFFSVFYFMINAGSVLTTIISPIIRDSECFGMDKCFAVGFGLPAVLMIVAIILFVAGQSLYKKIPPNGNAIVEMVKCIWTAVSLKLKRNTVNPGTHWLDYAEETHGISKVNDCKKVLSILLLYLPFPLFWALFDQQGSRWVVQAMKLDGNFSSFTIKPDQLQVANPLLILAFIPLCQFVVYPFLSIFGIRRPLQKMALGGILAGCSYLCTMFLEMQINEAAPNTINILWQLPQFVVMALAEVMFSITGLEFAFTQAPESMKSVIQAFWMLTVAIGDFIIALIVGSRLLESQAMEFLLFAVLMFIDMIIFMGLAYRYKSTVQSELKINS